VTEPVYDGRLITALEGLVVEGDHGWTDLCRELDITPLSIAYEDLVDPRRYDDVVRSVLAHLGGDDPGLVVRPPRTDRRGVDLNGDWTRRYLADRADPR
jgi:LPS sulfotransferase NodH